MKRARRVDAASPRSPREAYRDLERQHEALSRRLDRTELDLARCQAERARLEDAVSRMNTLAALGQMAATVAHEIRNPLGGIAGFAGLLERDLPVDDPRRRWVKKIIEGVSSLNTIVTGLLNYTRPVRLNAHPIDIVNLIEESASFVEIDLARREDPRVSISRAYRVPGATCRIDPEQMQQVFLNLLQNAAQAMPEGGTITVSVELEAEEGADPGQGRRREAGGERQEGAAPGPPLQRFAGSLHRPEPQSEGWVAVSVSDTGAGMPEEVQGRLFTPFFTTKENGTGLGLATARKIVEAHRGTIRVASEVGRGSTFVVAIPMARGEYNPAAGGTAATSSRG